MKINRAALSGSRALLWSEITSPATLNKRSDGTLVGGRPRYTRASLATSASRSLFCLHHANGFSIQPITGSDRYCVNCVSMVRYFFLADCQHLWTEPYHPSTSTKQMRAFFDGGSSVTLSVSDSSVVEPVGTLMVSTVSIAVAEAEMLLMALNDSTAQALTDVSTPSVKNFCLNRGSMRVAMVYSGCSCIVAKRSLTEASRLAFVVLSRSGL